MVVDKINMYCPLCTYDALAVGAIGTFKIGPVSASATVGTVTAEGTTDSPVATLEKDTGARFGRNLTVVSDTASTTQKVTVKGYDFYNQPMSEEFTLNGTTSVVGKKAFKTVCEITLAKGAAQTVTVSTGLKLGLPLRTTKILASIKNGADDTSNATLTAGYNTTQTATSNDPRGVVAMSAISANDTFTVVGVVSDEVFTISSNLVGGLQGIPHYFA